SLLVVRLGPLTLGTFFSVYVPLYSTMFLDVPDTVLFRFWVVVPLVVMFWSEVDVDRLSIMAVDRLSAGDATGLTIVTDWFCCAPTDEEFEELCALLSALCA
ncbi:hypothetical protein XA67_24500, partial [Comamonas thiooxydans]